MPKPKSVTSVHMFIPGDDASPLVAEFLETIAATFRQKSSDPIFQFQRRNTNKPMILKYEVVSATPESHLSGHVYRFFLADLEEKTHEA